VPSSNNIHRLQDTFLAHLQRQKTPVTVFLQNGVKLQGVIAAFDAFCVMIERDGQQQIVYKHAIATTLPATAVDLRDETDAPAAPEEPKALVVERRGRSRFGG
jgi:host factor-I protein